MNTRICSIPQCGRRHQGLGYCEKHYNNFYKTGNPLGKFNGDRKRRFESLRLATLKHTTCKIDGCGIKHYAKGYCKKHYATFIRRSGYARHKCKVFGCNTTTLMDYCQKHKKRIQRGLPLDLSIKCNNRGEKNGRWNGGISDYPNHYEFKKNRLIVLQRAKALCEVCGKTGKHIHHKDGSKTNHDLDNLILLCRKCHWLIHTGRKNKTSKFINLYGATILELSNKFNLSLGTVYKMHKENKLKEFLTSKKRRVE